MTKNKICCIQISNELINGKPNLKDLSTKYHEELYKNKNNEGYYKNKDFWEVPLWITQIDYNISVDLYICRSINDTIKFLLDNNYKFVCFSVLDVNKDIIKYIIKTYERTFYNTLNEGYMCNFILGGYINFKEWELDFKQIMKPYTIFNSIKDFIVFLGIEFKEGYSYRLFNGLKCIPRLTLSTGCKHKCAFCTIENNIKETPREVIEQQLKEFTKYLDFKLIYINDKTYGQASNYDLLPYIYEILEYHNPQFKGFIIQTTTSQFTQFEKDFIEKSHIKYIELGIESYNDDILKKYNKPSTEKIINDAIDYIRRLKHIGNIDLWLIPNIIIGIPEENRKSYLNTYMFLVDCHDIISHFNIYNLAIYENTLLSKWYKNIDKNDQNELSLNKSFHKDKKCHIDFYELIYNLGIDILNFEIRRYKI